MIVLDTHIWVNWILLGETSLSRPVLAAMDSQSSMAISAISCFEVSLLVKQGKLELPLPVDEWFSEALSGSGIECLPVTCLIAQRSVALQNVHGGSNHYRHRHRPRCLASEPRLRLSCLFRNLRAFDRPLTR